MNRKFKAPPAADLKQWAKVQFLSDHGFRFGSIVENIARPEVRCWIAIAPSQYASYGAGVIT